MNLAWSRDSLVDYAPPAGRVGAKQAVAAAPVAAGGASAPPGGAAWHGAQRSVL